MKQSQLSHEVLNSGSWQEQLELYLLKSNKGELARGIAHHKEYAFPETYQSQLPRFKHKDLVQWIDYLIRKKKSPVNICDIGFGVGMFLLDAREKWQSNVVLHGVGTLKHSQEEYLDNPPTEPKLQQAKINLFDSNFSNLSRLELPKMDIITACHVIYWLSKKNQIQVLRQMYDLLEKDGVMFVRGVTVDRKDIEALSISKRNIQYQVSLQKLAIKK